MEKDTKNNNLVSFTNADEDRIQPNAIVYLPYNKQINIYSLVSLVANKQYANSNDNGKREQYLNSNLLSVKNHTKQLCEKEYQRQRD